MVSWSDEVNQLPGKIKTLGPRGMVHCGGPSHWKENLNKARRFGRHQSWFELHFSKFLHTKLSLFSRVIVAIWMLSVFSSFIALSFCHCCPMFTKSEHFLPRPFTFPCLCWCGGWFLHSEACASTVWRNPSHPLRAGQTWPSLRSTFNSTWREWLHSLYFHKILCPHLLIGTNLTCQALF